MFVSIAHNSMYYNNNSNLYIFLIWLLLFWLFPLQHSTQKAQKAQKADSNRTCIFAFLMKFNLTNVLYTGRLNFAFIFLILSLICEPTRKRTRIKFSLCLKAENDSHQNISDQIWFSLVLPNACFPVCQPAYYCIFMMCFSSKIQSQTNFPNAKPTAPFCPKSYVSLQFSFVLSQQQDTPM